MLFEFLNYRGSEKVPIYIPSPAPPEKVQSFSNNNSHNWPEQKVFLMPGASHFKIY